MASKPQQGLSISLETQPEQLDALVLTGVRNVKLTRFSISEQFTYQQDSERAPTETTPLITYGDSSARTEATLQDEKISRVVMFWEEVRTIPSYALPVFWFVVIQTILILH